MKAILFKKGGREHAAYTDVPDPVLKKTDVLVRVYASDICKPADGAHYGGYSVFGSYPLIPGHEYAGIVEAIGKGVTRFQVGDRVTADANKPCGKCYYCERGEVMFCDNNEAYGQTLNGGFAELVAVDEDLVYRIPDSVSMKAASMTELAGCAYNCMERCHFKYGSEVLILGCGASGNLLAQMAKSSAAATVVAVDMVSSKLEKIKTRGIETVLVDREHYEKHEAVLKERFPHGFDYIIDTTADSGLITRSISLLKKGGTFVNYAFQNNVNMAKKIELDTKMFATRQLNYIGSTFQHFKFPQTLKAIEEGKVDPELAITEVLPLDKFFDGMEHVLNDPHTIKVVFEPNGPSEGR